MWTSFAAAALSSACSTTPDCPSYAQRCVGSALQVCTPHPANEYSLSDRHPASPSTWDPLEDCGTADLCLESTRVNSDGETIPDAFCALDPTTAPACVALGEPLGTLGPGGLYLSTCEGSTNVDCYDGFAVARRVCSACSDNGGGNGQCAGGYLAICTAASDCAQGLDCVENNCVMACACAEGASCAACAPLEHDAANVSDESGTPFTWVCTAGRCSQTFQ